MKLQSTKPIFSDNRSILAFTMIEVAMSLAIVAFAMVAIIGVLPTGLNVQRQNSEETIISQDGTYLLEAMRQGSLAGNLFQLESNLTMVEIASEFNPVGNPQRYFWSISNTAQAKPGISNLVLQMARPRQSEILNDGTASSYYTNSTRLRFYAMSGNMTAVLGSAGDRMQYEVQVEVIAGGAGVTNHSVFYTNTFSSSFVKGNLHTVKLTYRWPVLPNGRLGAGQKVLLTQFRGYLKPVKLVAGNFVDIETDNAIDVQNIDEIGTLPAALPTGLFYGHLFEGTMLR